MAGDGPLRILFATAELSPLARVGGLAEASAGLVQALRRAGHDVEVVLPDYGGIELTGEAVTSLDDVPEWCGPTRARRGRAEGFGDVTLIDRIGLARSHPYVDPDTGEGWPDNDWRFAGFAAAVAALVRRRRPDVLHLNDWHTALAPAFLAERPPVVLTIHTLGYQGWSHGDWIGRLPVEGERWESFGACNPLLGAIRTADRVIAVSPSYAAEITTPEAGMGLDAELAARGDALVGILNGIDVEAWDPASDPYLPQAYGPDDLDGKLTARAELARIAGWPADRQPILGVVSRLVDQKGIDWLLGLVPMLDTLPGRIALLGSGQADLTDAVRRAAAAHPDRIHAVTDRYDEPLAHLIFGGADLFCMPSRFEPCGLAQMQAMRYGTIPIVTPVGGLRDTVLDDDRHPGAGTGFVAPSADQAGVVDAVHRAVRACRLAARRRGLQARGMDHDWSWDGPAARHVELYRDLLR